MTYNAMLWEDQHYKIRHRLQPHIFSSNGGHFNPLPYPPVSSPIHPRNQIQLRIYIKSIVLSVSWMRNWRWIQGSSYSECVHWNKTYIEKKKGQCTLGTRKKKVEHSTKLKQVGIVTCTWLIFFFLANVNLIS